MDLSTIVVILIIICFIAFVLGAGGLILQLLCGIFD